MSTELKLKNGRCRAFPDAIAKVLVKRGLGTYLTRDMRAAEPAITAPEAAAVVAEVEVASQAPDDLESLKAQADARGIKYHHRAGVAKLRELLAA